MSTEVLRFLGYAVAGVAIVATVFFLELLLSKLANRFAARSSQYRQRIGTQLPRIRQ